MCYFVECLKNLALDIVTLVITSCSFGLTAYIIQQFEFPNYNFLPEQFVKCTMLMELFAWSIFHGTRFVVFCCILIRQEQKIRQLAHRWNVINAIVRHACYVLEFESDYGNLHQIDEL